MNKFSDFTFSLHLTDLVELGLCFDKLHGNAELYFSQLDVMAMLHLHNEFVGFTPNNLLICMDYSKKCCSLMGFKVLALTYR